MLFKYKGYDSSGKKTSGKFEASDFNTAKLKLKQKKIIFTDLKEDSYSFFEKLKIKKRYKLPVSVLSSFSRDLSIYLSSGISLLNSVKLINERYKNDKKLSPFFESIISLLDEGKNFYTSLDTQNIVELPDFYLQSIRISEDGGILQDVLLELATYLDEQHKLQKQISSAMTYPIFIIVVSLLMVGFMLTYIVPTITSIFEGNGQVLPEITQLVVNSGEFMSQNYPYMLGFVLLLIVSFSFLMKKSYKFKYMVDKFLLKVPFLGALIELNELSRFAYMNAILIKSGVPVVQAFKMGANILNNSVIQELFNDASLKVVEGEKLSRILDNHKIYKVDIAFIQAIAIGEETSQLSKVLQSLAELYSNTNKDKMDKFLALLGPMLMLFVGIVIGFIVIAMLLPIFSMSIG
jgi:general secretion pathway protein F/type IV pilus assembly protein PilC